MKILCVSDWKDPLIYSIRMKERMKDVDMVISCGDLPAHYLDFIMSELNVPLYYVVGNHVKSKHVRKNLRGKIELNMPDCFLNLHLKMRKEGKVLMTGFQGCHWYNGGPFQYKQWQVYVELAKLIPRLLLNKLIYGRYLDIFVSHAPAFGVGDESDNLCHEGLKAFNWFLKTFEPALFLHGHVHLYDKNKGRQQTYCRTNVVNCTGFYVANIEPADGKKIANHNHLKESI